MIEIENDGFGNWCPDCGEPREVCQCDERLLYADDDFETYDRSNDPNCCPDCDGDLTAADDWLYCQDIECGWSEYLGDEEPEGNE